jgi:V/A-type H+-transporting ATPase subunit I
MAIAPMAKVMIVTHRSQAELLLEALQTDGICQVLNAEEAIVSKDAPELAPPNESGAGARNLLVRLERAIALLQNFSERPKGLQTLLAPRAVVAENTYKKVVSDRGLHSVIEESENIQAESEKLNSRAEDLRSLLKMLEPWAPLQTPVEEIGTLDTTACLAGMLPAQNFQQTKDSLSELDAAVQLVGNAENKYACLVVCLKQSLPEAQKLLRSAEFEQVNFAPLAGTPAELIRRHRKSLDEVTGRLKKLREQAAKLSRNLLNLQILYDHYNNLLEREKTQSTAPATEHTVILEGWVRRRDYKKLEKTVSNFEAAGLTEIQPADDEDIPVEIENKKAVKPFEVITRLYGMPVHLNVDPTAFLAPFFALFFALCLTDAGYGILIVVLMVLFIKKMQGDKKFMWMMGICAAATIVAGALTGGWFGDAIQKFLPALKPLRQKCLWFDPLENPLTFFKLSLVLGYIQIMTGLIVAFIHNLRGKDYLAAFCDQLTWLVMLNSIAGLGLAKAAVISPKLTGLFAILAVPPAVVIFALSERQGGVAQRLGLGAYNLFSAVFYLGDILSYARLMALGMVTAGFGMAINVIVEMVADIKVPVLGYILAVVIFIAGHLFNAGMSALSAFVHTLRLQFVEFFPKFFVGGGRQFQPLAKQYKHIYIATESK